MKITNRKGIVRSYSSGSIEKQHEELVQIARYIQKQLDSARFIIDETNMEKQPVVNEKKKARESADAIRREAEEIGILQNRKENQNG